MAAFEETYVILADGSVVGPDNPMPSQGVAGATSDITVHGHANPTRWVEPNTDGSVDAETRPRALTATYGQGAVGSSGAVEQFLAGDATRRYVRVTNLHASHMIFVGHAAVTITTGDGIPPGATHVYEDAAALFIVSSATGDTVSWAAYS